MIRHIGEIKQHGRMLTEHMEGMYHKIVVIAQNFLISDVVSSKLSVMFGPSELASFELEDTSLGDTFEPVHVENGILVYTSLV